VDRVGVNRFDRKRPSYKSGKIMTENDEALNGGCNLGAWREILCSTPFSKRVVGITKKEACFHTGP